LGSCLEGEVDGDVGALKLGAEGDVENQIAGKRFTNQVLNYVWRAGSGEGGALKVGSVDKVRDETVEKKVCESSFGFVCGGRRQ
jgi:hypothetical protein